MIHTSVPYVVNNYVANYVEKDSPFCWFCAQSKKALIILIVEFDVVEPGTERYRYPSLEVHSLILYGDTHRNVDRMGVESDRLSVAVVVCRKGIFHVFEGGRVVDGACSIGVVTNHKVRGRHKQTISRASSQPRIHQMGSSDTKIVEKGVHGDFPEARELRFALAASGNFQAVIRHTIVQCIRPKRITIGICDGNGGGSGRVVSEFGFITTKIDSASWKPMIWRSHSQPLESIDGVVQERCAEAFDGGKRNACQGIQGNKVTIDFSSRWVADMVDTEAGINVVQKVKTIKI